MGWEQFALKKIAKITTEVLKHTRSLCLYNFTRIHFLKLKPS
jgi:hypothetical protein